MHIKNNMSLLIFDTATLKRVKIIDFETFCVGRFKEGYIYDVKLFWGQYVHLSWEYNPYIVHIQTEKI